jgi:omega-amidase
MKIACVQLNIIWENKQENFNKVEKLIREAVDKGVELVCLPELFSTGFTMNSEKFAETIPGATSRFLADQAKRYRIHVIGGLIEKIKTKPRNTCIVLNPKGRLILRYYKIHPFSLGKEDKNYDKGNKISLFEMDGVTASALICYDLRFPELFSAAAEKGAKLIFVIANWPLSRREHWKILLRARAIENQIFIVGVNRVGSAPIADYTGDSAIIDPLGNVIARDSNTEEIIIGDIEGKDVGKVRKEFPFFKDRRPELYKTLY